MAAFKRTDWNGLIQEVNDVLTKPPADTDCEPLPPIDEVGPNHRWSKADIQQVQDAIKGTCADISFEPIPDLWKQSIVDDIREALGQAWCDCEDECDEEAIEAEDGTEFLLYDNGPIQVSSNCLGNDTPPIPLCDLIHGMQVGEPNIVGRTWQVRRVNYRQGGGEFTTVLQGGIVECDGTVKCTSSNVQIFTHAGIFVFCPTCDDFCFEVIGDAEDRLSNPDLFFSRYFLTVKTIGATCEDCDAPIGGGGGE